MLGGLGLKIRQVPAMEAIETILASASSPNSRRGNRVLEILTLREIQHLEEADPNPRGAIEVRCSIPKTTVLSVAVLIVESADRALMRVSVAIRVVILLETAHWTEVRLEVMLNLGLIHRLKQQPSLLRGTSFMPKGQGGAREVC